MNSAGMNNTGSVLVTGGAGYIGSHVVLGLRDAGYPVVVLDDLSTGDAAALPPDVKLIRGSTGDADLVTATLRAHGVTALMHFAASLVVPESLTHPLCYWQNNVCNTATLMQACVEAGLKTVVFSSTAAVYGVPDSPSVDEDAITRPINPYGASKLAAEAMLGDAARGHGVRVAVLRYFNVAGADPAGRAGQRTRGATHLIKVACEAACGQRHEVAIFGENYDTLDGTGIRDYIHVSDLADAHLLALAYLRDGGGCVTLNCGYGTGHSVRDVLDAVQRASGIQLRVRGRPRRDGDPPVLIARAERIGRVLGWRPRHASLDEIVASSLRWERAMLADRPARPDRLRALSG